jgi:hypothetical protein
VAAVDDLILIIAPEWQWIAATGILCSFSATCGAALMWALRVRPLEAELAEWKRETDEGSPPSFPPIRPQTDTLVSL